MGVESENTGSVSSTEADNSDLREKARDRGSHLFDMQAEENLSNPELRDRLISARQGELGPYIEEIWEGYRQRSVEWHKTRRIGKNGKIVTIE